MSHGRDPDPFVVSSATSADVRSVANIHKQVFSDHFLGQYPVDLLESFYDSFCGRSIFLVAHRESHVLGFVLGGERTALASCRRDFVRRNAVSLSWHTMRRPQLWGGVLRRALGALSPARESRAMWRLLSIARIPEAQGTGVAGALVSAFEQRVPTREAYGLSVRDTNERAIGFYEKCGMEREGSANGSVYFVVDATARKKRAED